MTLEHRSAAAVKTGLRIAASVWRIFLLAYISPSLSISFRLAHPILICLVQVRDRRHSDSGNCSQHSRARRKPQHWANLPRILTSKSRLAILVSDSGCPRCYAVLRKPSNVNILVVTHLNKGHVQSLHPALSYLIVLRDRRQDLVR